MKKLISIFLLLLSSESLAQEYIVREYRTKSELANQTVFHGIELPGKMLYFLTEREFIGYDGIQFRKLFDLTISDIANPRIVRDEFNNLWFYSTEEEKIKLIKFDGHTFESIDAPDEIDKFPFVAVSNGKIFLGIPKGIFFYYQDEKWYKNKLPEEFRDSEITSIKAVRQNIFISTNKGMFYSGSLSFSSYQTITSKPVYAFYHDEAENKTYILMDNAIGIYKNGNLDFLQYNFSIRKNRSDNIYINEILDNQLSIGTGYSHYLFNKEDKKFDRLEKVFNLKTVKSNYSFRDSFNNIWITSELGINKVSKKLFKTYNKKDGIWEDDVTAIDQFKNGNIILGHKNGITLVNDKKFIKVPIKKTNSGGPPHVIDMIIDSKHRTWFLIQHEGLGRIDDINDPDNIAWFRHKDYSKYNTITLLENDDIFLATGTAFLKISDDSIKVLYELDYKYQQYFRRVIKLSDSVLVTAGNNGLLFYNYKQNKIENQSTAVRLFTSLCVYKDNIMVGGHSGLYQFEKGKLTPFKFLGKELKNEVYFIKYIATKDELWIGTNNGAYKWKDNKLMNFQTSEGLADDETNRSAFLYNEQDGSVWIGTIGGVSIYQRNLENLYSTKPILNIDNVLVNNKAHGEDYSKLESIDGNATLKFSAMSLYNNPSINYETEITGLDSEYYNEYTSASGIIEIEDLPVGFYELSTVALDKFGNKSDKVKINLNVSSDNRASNFQVIIIILFILGSTYSFIVWRKKYSLNKRPEQEKSLPNAGEKTYCINIFGNFTIVSPNDGTIEAKFSPRSRELFLLLLIHSFNGNNLRGISSEKMSKMIWEDSSTQNTKNKRNLAIKKLRELLSENLLGSIVFDSDRWIIKLNESVSFDYPEWYNLREKFKDTIFPGQNDIKDFLKIVGKGNFLNDLSYQWIEEIKIWHNNESVNILSRITREAGLDIDLRFEAGKILNSIDPLNETEIKYYIKLLYDQDKPSQAAYIYEQFCNEYQDIFGKKYKKDLTEIVSEK